MSDCIKISTSSENYLEAIFHLSQGGNPVRSVDVAERIGVSKASVNKAISVLRQAGMVEQELYGTIILTPLGSSRAKEVVRRHMLLKRFLTEVLGVCAEVADEDACRMEHVISEETISRLIDHMERILGS